jgi:hypothetical protein
MNVGRRNNSWSGISELDTPVGRGMCAVIVELAAAICTAATVGSSIGANSVIHATSGGCAILYGLAAATGIAAAPLQALFFSFLLLTMIVLHQYASP